MIIFAICNQTLRIKFGASWPNLTRENWLSIIPEEHTSALKSQALKNAFEEKINALRDFALTYYHQENEQKTMCCYPIAIDYVVNTQDYVSPIVPKIAGYLMFGFKKIDQNAPAVNSVNDEIVELMCEFLTYNAAMAIRYYFSQPKLGIEANLELLMTAMGNCRYEADVLAEFFKKTPIHLLKNLNIDAEKSKLLKRKNIKANYKILIDDQFVIKDFFDYFVKKHQEIRGSNKRLKSFEARSDDFLSLLSLFSKHLLHKDVSDISRALLEKEIKDYLLVSGRKAEEKIKNTASVISSDNYMKQRNHLMNMIAPANFEVLVTRCQEFGKIIIELVSSSLEQKSSEMILAKKIHAVILQSASINNSEEIIIQSLQNNDNSFNTILEADQPMFPINALPEELMVKILMKARTPQELLSWGHISPRVRDMLFDKKLWESFVPKELKHHQYLPRVYQFFARTFFAPQYQYSLNQWLRNPQEFHEALVKWSDPKVSQDYLTAEDDPELPFLFGHDWAKKLVGGVSQVPSLEVTPDLFSAAARMGDLASMQELWALSKKKKLSNYEYEQKTWNLVGLVAFNHAIKRNHWEMFKWLLEISYGIAGSGERIMDIFRYLSEFHWPLVKYYAENNLFNVRVITVSLDPKNIKKILPSLEEVCVDAPILIKHNDEFFVVGTKTSNTAIFIDEFYISGRDMTDTAILRVDAFAHAGRELLSKIRRAPQRPALKKITNTDLAVFNRLQFSSTPEKQLIPLSWFSVSILNTEPDAQAQLYGLKNADLRRRECMELLEVLVEHKCREGIEWLLQEASHNSDYASEMLATCFDKISRLVSNFYTRKLGDPETIHWLTKSALDTVVQVKYSESVHSKDGYRRGAHAERNIDAFLQDCAPYIFDNYLPAWLKVDFPSLLLTNHFPHAEAVKINDNIKRAAVKFHCIKKISLTAEDYRLLDSIFCSAILMLKIALTKSDSEQKEAVDYARTVCVDFEKSGEPIDKCFEAHYTEFKLIALVNADQKAKNKALGLSELPIALISCAFNQWCAAEESLPLCYFLWHHSSQKQKEMLVKKHLVDIDRNLPQWLRQELNELQAALTGESYDEQKAAIRQAKVIARDILDYVKLFDEETKLKLQELYQQFNTLSKTIPLIQVKRTIDCGQTVFHLSSQLPEGYLIEEEEKDQQNIIIAEDEAEEYKTTPEFGN